MRLRRFPPEPADVGNHHPSATVALLCRPVITCFPNPESWNFKALLLISFCRAREAHGQQPPPSPPPLATACDRLRPLAGRVREGQSCKSAGATSRIVHRRTLNESACSTSRRRFAADSLQI